MIYYSKKKIWIRVIQHADHMVILHVKPCGRAGRLPSVTRAHILRWQQAKVRILRKFRICIIRKSGNRCDNIMAGREEMDLKRQASAPLYEAIERFRKKE